MRNDKIDYLKCFCAVFVIMHHSIAALTRDYGCSFSDFFGFVTAPIYAHVSIFIVIAGFLCHEKALKPFYTSKFNRIIVPFFVFSLLKIVYSLTISSKYAHADSLWNQVFDAFVLGRLYWFSYCIFILYCLAPFIWAGTRKNPRFPCLALLAFVCICIVNDHTKCLSRIPYFQIHAAVQNMPYFLVGYILQVNQNKVSSFISNSNHFILIVVFFLAYLANYFLDKSLDLGLHYIFTIIQKLSVLGVLYVIACHLKPGKAANKIAKYSYQLMLIDSFTRVMILNIIDRLFTINKYWMIPQTVLSVISCVMICEVLSKWKITRRLAGL